MALRTISVCAGIGALDLGFHRAFPESRTVLYVEREVYPTAVLAARMQDGWLDEAPIWSDLTTIDATAWCGSVDCLIGGIPCQPFSVAGKRQGTDDERWIWADVLRIIREAGIRLVALENVPGFVRHGLPTVLGDLAELGFDAAWRVVSAASVGAPHIRRRMFLLAHRRCERDGAIQHGSWSSGAATDASAGGEAVADSDGAPVCFGRCAVGVRAEHAWPRINGAGGGHADAQWQLQPQRCQSNKRGWTRDAGFPPAPDDLEEWRRILSKRPDLAPATQPALRVMAHEPSARMDELRALGNAVVVRQAATAFAQLRRDLGI